MSHAKDANAPIIFKGVTFQPLVNYDIAKFQRAVPGLTPAEQAVLGPGQVLAWMRSPEGMAAVLYKQCGADTFAKTVGQWDFQTQCEALGLLFDQFWPDDDESQADPTPAASPETGN